MIEDKKSYPHKLCKRYNIASHAHGITFSCYQRLPLLRDDSACKCLCDAIERARSKYDFAVWAYVLMPEHVHLLIKPVAENYSISNILKAIKQPVSQSIKAHNHHMNFGDAKFHFWQAGGGYDSNITWSQEVVAVINYIHMNPVRRHLVECPEQWYYSSYKDWQQLGAGPISIDKEIFI